PACQCRPERATVALGRVGAIVAQSSSDPRRHRTVTLRLGRVISPAYLQWSSLQQPLRFPDFIAGPLCTERIEWACRPPSETLGFVGLSGRRGLIRSGDLNFIVLRAHSGNSRDQFLCRFVNPMPNRWS